LISGPMSGKGPWLAGRSRADERPVTALCSRWLTRGGWAKMPYTCRSRYPPGPAQLGRVGVWRGGCRPNIAVAAPFVWRCLTGSTLAPFPHSAHRTGHADLSGSAAIAGFCPHGSRRAALPQRALQGGPEEAGRSSVPSLMDNRFGEREDGQEPFVRRPSNATFLASLAECRPAQEGADQLRLSHAKLAREPVRRRSRPPPHWSDAYRR